MKDMFENEELNRAEEFGRTEDPDRPGYIRPPDCDDEEDAFLKMMYDLFQEEETGVFVTNLQKVKQMENLYNTLREVVWGEDLSIECQQNDPGITMGHVSIEAKSVTIVDGSRLVEAARHAKNFEVYTKTDGTIRIDFTFYDVARKVGD